MIAAPRNEFPEFPAALSFVFGLTPAELLTAFEKRAAVLKNTFANLERELQGTAGPPRLFLLETEYLRTVAAAELNWVTGTVEEIRTGRLNWRGEELAELAKHRNRRNYYMNCYTARPWPLVDRNGRRLVRVGTAAAFDLPQLSNDWP
jgi:hypothetical protein